MFSPSRRVLTQALFLALEGLIYVRFLFLDLVGQGAAGNSVKYLGIILCTLFAWHQGVHGGSRLVAWALTLTLGADWFLLMLDRYYALGLLLFCGVQGLYLLRISRANGGRTLWGARLVLCLLSPALLAVLGRLTGENLLALIYFSNFLCNVALAVRLPRGWGRQFALGLTLFLCCDVCVGIFQSPGLLPPALEAFASLGMWLFYLPGQVLIVLSGRDPHEMRSFHENQ